ncbi:D-glycero-alpha-D-manno-heptose-1,7-bisphosphate 7-phosphatase [Kitasatospora cineracea]|uniref:D,D-heptose 1,7-bisphosphate phosphatase n=1 Tax=Kitasatospora cineracea TaxID=88074 RepID=A0A8G1UL97_9ACTN|nr:HAD-IIIA family hydrolase [Kitasatospora cineracea]ROR46120.1 histidinol-phosphate phosphatase family protein/HAD superfamily hydrolase (TIGR01662 family) [Kitasatospora cineracea]
MEFAPHYLEPSTSPGQWEGGGSWTPSSRASGPWTPGAGAAGPWVVLRGGAGGGRTDGEADAPGGAVLLDRDAVLVADIAYNGDPGRVYPRPGAREAVAELRALGVRLGVVTDQPGIARGALTRPGIERVHHRIEELFGPFDVWAVCPHRPADCCGCRKPAPGLVLAAARALRVRPERTTLVGGTGADLVAAASAGVHGLLVRPDAARPGELAVAGHRRAADLPAAVRLLCAAGTVPAVSVARAVAAG